MLRRGPLNAPLKSLHIQCGSACPSRASPHHARLFRYSAGYVSQTAIPNSSRMHMAGEYVTLLTAKVRQSKSRYTVTKVQPTCDGSCLRHWASNISLILPSSRWDLQRCAPVQSIPEHALIVCPRTVFPRVAWSPAKAASPKTHGRPFSTTSIPRSCKHLPIVVAVTTQKPSIV